MEKYELISMALSTLIIVLLPLHSIFVSSLGPHEWLNMVFGLPIGMATACNIEIVIHKIRRKK